MNRMRTLLAAVIVSGSLGVVEVRAEPMLAAMGVLLEVPAPEENAPTAPDTCVALADGDREISRLKFLVVLLIADSLRFPLIEADFAKSGFGSDLLKEYPKKAKKVEKEDAPGSQETIDAIEKAIGKNDLAALKKALDDRKKWLEDTIETLKAKIKTLEDAKKPLACGVLDIIPALGAI